MPTPTVPHGGNATPFEYDRITPFVWIGTNQCCTSHFSHTLRRLGIRSDVSLESERLDAAYGVQYFLWLPVRDHAAPSQAQLRVGAHALQHLVESRVKTYVHCRNGHGRAPTLVAAYLILTEGCTVKDTIRRIALRRPDIHIEPAQRRALERFAAWASHHRRPHA